MDFFHNITPFGDHDVRSICQLWELVTKRHKSGTLAIIVPDVPKALEEKRIGCVGQPRASRNPIADR
jgi:hypothetical protein